MVYGGAVGDAGRGGVRVGVDDFVAALLALADDGGDAAEDAFAFKGGGGGRGAVFDVVAVEDFGAGGEAGACVSWGGGIS